MPKHITMQTSKILDHLAHSASEKQRMAVAGNESLSDDSVILLAEDPSDAVRLTVARREHLPVKAILTLAKDANYIVRVTIAKHHVLSARVQDELIDRLDWETYFYLKPRHLTRKARSALTQWAKRETAREDAERERRRRIMVESAKAAVSIDSIGMRHDKFATELERRDTTGEFSELIGRLRADRVVLTREEGELIDDAISKAIADFDDVGFGKLDYNNEAWYSR